MKKTTIEAFDRYVQATEARLGEEMRSGKFLWLAASPERLERVHHGEILAQPWNEKGETSIPDGLIHDWIGAVFIPGATLARTLAVVNDYDNRKNIYKPEVLDSKLLSKSGDDVKVYMRLLKKKVITVVLNTEHDVRHFPMGPNRLYSRSHSTRIAEVENPGKPSEHELPVGRDHGFLWRLYSYWKFEERDDGVYVECEAISLTRSVPSGLAWLIAPIIRNLPRESLVHTLEATRAAVAAHH